MISFIIFTICIIAIIFACNLLWNYVIVCLGVALLLSVFNEIIEIIRDK